MDKRKLMVVRRCKKTRQRNKLIEKLTPLEPLAFKSSKRVRKGDFKYANYNYSR
ncbi:MAG: hypothetical protein CM15mV109_210 [uncultured marine virus]|nr:MAG: hypothetical protein CM15mV109_210 [uncultured marine virus]